MKHLFNLLLMLTILLILCGCSKQVALTAEDELVMNKWNFKGENGYSATLEFKDELAFFTVYDNGVCKTKIDGNYIMSSSGFSITDKEFPATFTFDYDLKGDSVSLSYDGAEILMKRIDN